MNADFTPEKEDYKILTPFKMQVLTNFPYIEADFDALTNYQLLCKIVEYLNNVINNENEVTKQITSLYNAYIELQDYINKYFDNLDVQEEINNKLDEMAESGQLTDIIAQYLGLAGMITFNNVSEMKLAENLVNGSKCATLGYYNVNDGGNAFYKVRQVTNDDVVDEMFIIALYDENLIAELIIDNPLKVEQIGAHGDGITDDTNVIQAGINKTNNLLLPKTYKITEITISKGDFNFEFNHILGKIKVDSTQMIQFLKIKGKRLTNESGVGLSLISHNSYGIQYCSFSINLIRADECIKFDSSNGGWINNNYFDKCNVSYHTGISSVALTNKYYNGNMFNEFGFEDITKWFIINNFQDTQFTNCRMLPFEADGSSAIHELGILNNSRNIFFNNPTSGTYWEMITSTTSTAKYLTKIMSAGGTNDADYLRVTNGSADVISSPCPQLILDIGNLSSGTFPVQVYEYDLTKPIILDFTNGSRYMYMNLNIPANLENAIKYVTIQIIGTTSNEVDLRIRNQEFHVIPTGTSDKTFTYFLN